MSTSRQFAIMSLHAGQKNYQEVYTIYLSHSAISSIDCGKGSWSCDHGIIVSIKLNGNFDRSVLYCLLCVSRIFISRMESKQSQLFKERQMWFLNVRIPARNTRGARRDQFDVERYNNLKYKNSPFFKGSVLWNQLPLDIAQSDSIFQFKKSLKNI